MNRWNENNLSGYNTSCLYTLNPSEDSFTSDLIGYQLATDSEPRGRFLSPLWWWCQLPTLSLAPTTPLMLCWLPVTTLNRSWHFCSWPFWSQAPGPLALGDAGRRQTRASAPRNQPCHFSRFYHHCRHPLEPLSYLLWKTWMVQVDSCLFSSAFTCSVRKQCIRSSYLIKKGKVVPVLN
jgi:hypothetical protein